MNGYGQFFHYTAALSKEHEKVSGVYHSRKGYILDEFQPSFIASVTARHSARLMKANPFASRQAALTVSGSVVF